MAGKISALELQQKTSGIGILMEKISGEAKATGNPYHLAKFGYMGTSITLFIADEKQFAQLTEGETYKVSGTLSQEGRDLRLNSPKFEKVEGVL